MSQLQNYLEEYLSLRQALGYKLRTYSSSLKDFVRFAKATNTMSITTELALTWAMKPATADPKWWAYRLRLVHHFARFVHGRDPETQVPPLDLLPYCQRRKQPHFYSEGQMNRIVAAAETLPSHNGLRGLTYSTLFILIWVSGLRISEALGLDRDDVDPINDLLTIHNTKFNKSRLVPVQPSTSQALQHYARRRDQIFPRPKVPAFFLTVFGTRPTVAVADMTFRKLCCQIGIRNPSQKKGPRIHDIRHTFAVRTLIDLYRNDHDIDQGLHSLAVYLGHAGPSSTFWYLSAVPELMELVRDRLDRKGGVS
ncbi:MAG TPA: integrase [Desulfobacteraceae bacterium]|nr:integrase [Desulfobacteraceae bacterium]